MLKIPPLSRQLIAATVQACHDKATQKIRN